jgi:hypothetical protein
MSTTGPDIDTTVSAGAMLSLLCRLTGEQSIVRLRMTTVAYLELVSQGYTAVEIPGNEHRIMGVPMRADLPAELGRMIIGVNMDGRAYVVWPPVERDAIGGLHA